MGRQWEFRADMAARLTFVRAGNHRSAISGASALFSCIIQPHPSG